MVRAMPETQSPTVRLNVWLDDQGDLVFGHGRAILLQAVDEYGSLRKAASELGMSYRGAWGKIKKSEEILGFPLLEKAGGNKRGYQLTDRGRELMDAYFRWFEAVEGVAYRMAREIFPWEVRPFGPDSGPDRGPDGDSGDES